MDQPYSLALHRKLSPDRPVARTKKRRPHGHWRSPILMARVVASCDHTAVQQGNFVNVVLHRARNLCAFAICVPASAQPRHGNQDRAVWR
eukprot:3106709-Prymnesium_polylepis.1